MVRLTGDPYDISRVWIRNHHHGGWLTATWTHLRTGPVPFGELIWAHARQIVAARGTDPVTEAEIATAAADLLGRAEKGPEPGPGGQPPAPQGKAAGRRRSPRSRRVAGRAAATAAPQWPHPEPAPDGTSEAGDVAGQVDAGPRRAEDRAEQQTETPPAQVIPLPLFDARKEAEKWW